MTLRAVVALTLLSACTGNPDLGLGIVIGPGGVSVQPTLSTTIGGVNVGVAAPIP